MKNSLKYSAPNKPIIEINHVIPNLTITPANKADKLNITYQNTSNESTSIIANKINDNWSLNSNVDGITIEPQSGLVTINYQVVYPESVVVANDTTVNSDTSEESRENMPRKEATPEEPDIEANEEHVNVEVTPKGEASKVEIIYINPENEPASINAIKNGETWTLDKQVSHINIDGHTGKVTVGYQAVQAESEIVATETKGNSDSSSESKLKMPRKEVTPEAPDVEASEEQVNVEVTPKDDSTKLIINYTDTNGQSSSIIASKNGGVWSLDKQVPHIELDETNGKVTIGYQAVQAESEIIATETKGNSNSSTESKVTMPRKETTPEAPTIEADEEHANVEVTPKDEVTKLVINYTNQEGQTDSIIANKNDGTWSLNKKVSHVELDNQTSKITIGYQAVQAESEIVTTEIKGNSDPSIESKVNMPRKEVAPDGPTLTSDYDNVSVSISPSNKSDKMTIKYLDVNDQIATAIATKTNQNWSLNNDILGFSINSQTGKVTISHVAVQPESDIIATESGGNSDDSIAKHIIMPAKETKPEPPVVQSNINVPNVEIIPHHDVTKLDIHYTDIEGQPAIITATKVGKLWNINKNISNIELDESTGKVTIGYQTVQAASEVEATETKGNSDASAKSKVTMPRKEATPDAPTIEASEEQVNVEVTPKDEATKLVINYTNPEGQSDSIIASKNGEIWSLNKEVPNIQLNETTGKVKIGYQAVLAGSEISATETKGNSDASMESKVNMPIKVPTPDAPIIEKYVSDASVGISPKGEVTQLIIKYITPEGKVDSIIASKNEETWSLNKEVPHIQLDKATGKVIIGYQVVQAGSEVIAIATQGNSDASTESNVNMPIKEVTPNAPAVEASESHVYVEVTPKDESTKLVINYTNPEGQTDSIIASKNGETWSLNKEVPHIQLDKATGKVKIGYQAVQAESEIVATETKGNSDTSTKSKIIMPRKEATPDAPIVEKDERDVNVSIVPSGLSTKLEINYLNPKGQSEKILVNKNGHIWSLSKEITGITLEPTTGKVTIDYQVVYPESKITASGLKGNSDYSKLNSVIMPRKEKAPEPPIVTINEEEATVIIKPKTEATKVKINFKNKKGKMTYINIYKNGSEWSTDQVIKGIILNSHTGEIKITNLAIEERSEIVAREYKGNSDASVAIIIKVPSKVTNREVYKIKTSKVKLNDGSNEIKHIEKDKLKELPHTGENNQTNKTLLSSILILGLMLLRKSRKKEI